MRKSVFLFVFAFQVFLVSNGQSLIKEKGEETARRPHTILVYFTDSMQAPEVVTGANNKDGRTQFRSRSKRLQDYLSKSKLVKSERAFPAAADLSWHPLAASLLNYYLLTFDSDADSILNSMKKLKLSFAQPKGVYRQPDPLYEPNDYYNTVPGNLQIPKSSALEYIGARAAWDITRGSPEVKIGISDILFDSTCTELATKSEFLPGINFRDGGGHGTRVACIAAGATDNGDGLSAIGFNCRLICTNQDYNGILRAVAKGAKVINCSWGDTLRLADVNPEYKRIIDLVTSLGVTIVASAGNYPTSAGKYYFPAGFDNVISVSSVGHVFEIGSPNRYWWKDVHDGQIDYPGNETFVHDDRVDICAPGYGVYSTGGKNVYNNGWGTSFSAPFVAGTVGLLYSVYPSITPNEVQEILKCTAVPIDAISYNQNYVGKLGAGRLDAGAAVALANSKLTKAKPQDIIWNGDEAGASRIINPAEMLSFSTLRFTVSDAGAPAGTTYSWMINSYNKIVYKTGNSVTVTLAELGLKKGGGCAHLEVGVRRGVDCSSSYYYFEKQLCAKADFEKVLPESSPCSKYTVSFFNKSTDGQNFRWDFGDGSTSSEVNPVYNYTSPGKKYITLTVNGTVVKRDSIELKGGSFLVNGRSDNIFFCENQPVSFYYTPGDCGSVFSWNFGDGSSLSSEKNPVHTFPGRGPYKITLTVDGRFVYNQWLYVKPMLNDFDIKPFSNACNNTKFSFSLRETGGCVTACTWNFGNGTSGSGQNSAVISFVPGIYTVTARVNNNLTVSRQLIVGQAFPNFKYGSSNYSNSGEQLLLAGLPVLFSDLSVCATSYSWDFGDGTTSNLQNPEKVYLSPGNYTVRLTINGDNLLSISRVISVGCGKASGLTASNITRSAANLSWGNSGGSGTANLYFKKTTDKQWTIKENVISPYSLTGLEDNTRYMYFVMNQCNAGAAAASGYAYFTTSQCAVAQQSVVASSNLPAGSCGGSALQLDINQVANAVYQWSGPNGYTSTARNPTIPNANTSNNGVYSCTVFIGGCVAGNASVAVNVSNPPQPPSGLQIMNVGGNSVKLSWINNTPGARTDIQYKSRVSSVWSTITGITPPFTLAGLINSTAYSWQLKTDVSGCCSSWIPGTDFNTSQNCDAPLTSSVNNITNSSANISWPPAGNGVSTYALYFKKDDPNATMTAFSTSLTGSGSSITSKLASLTPNTRYEYRVFPKCVPGSNFSANYSGGFFTTQDCLPLTLRPVTGIATTRAVINWTNPTGCLGVKVELRPKGAADYNLVQSKLASPTQTFTFTGLAPGNEYEYRLTPYCGSAASGGSIGGSFSAGSFTTLNCLCSSTTIKACTGSISDGSGGNNYGNNVTCNWTISSPAGSLLSLSFLNFKTEKDKDILKVYKGSTPVAANLVGTFSGNVNPGVISINSNTMYVSFTSNASVTDAGWEAKFYSTACPVPAQNNTLSRTENSEESGIVNSISLFPNPYVDHVEIEMQQDLENSELVLADEDGRIVYKKYYDLMPNHVQIEFGEAVPPDDYILTIRKNGEMLFRQSLKNKRTNIVQTFEISDNQLLEDDINVFPNPYIDNFNIQVKKELKDVVLLMTDFQGRVVYRRDFRYLTGKTQIDMGATLPPGVYLLILRGTDKILLRKKIVAQK